MYRKAPVEKEDAFVNYSRVTVCFKKRLRGTSITEVDWVELSVKIKHSAFQHRYYH